MSNEEDEISAEDKIENYKESLENYKRKYQIHNSSIDTKRRDIYYIFFAVFGFLTIQQGINQSEQFYMISFSSGILYISFSSGILYILPYIAAGLSIIVGAYGLRTVEAGDVPNTLDSAENKSQIDFLEKYNESLKRAAEQKSENSESIAFWKNICIYFFAFQAILTVCLLLIGTF